MKILLIGNGGREHALAWRLRLGNPDIVIYSATENAGIKSISQHAQFNENDYTGIVKFCRKESIELVVVGPELPLSQGIANILRNEGILVFGPSKESAQIESSKVFAKNFMKKYKIPTALFEAFTEEKKAKDYVETLKPPIVVKADGLAAGKGVVICHSHTEAFETIESMFKGVFGEAGKKIIIEEFLEGEEASILAVTDGKRYLLLPSSQDHKRIFDDDRGKNTGGMGAYSPTPIITENVLNFVKKNIIEPTIEGLQQEGIPFVGCLYAGLMIKDDKAKVVEFNSRFGDPETQSVLPLVGGNFANLLSSAAKGSLDFDSYFEEKNKYVCCVILVSKGYPDKYQKGFEISGIRKAESLGNLVFHSGTKQVGDKVITDGGRVLGVCGIGSSLDDAINKAYKGVEVIHFENKYFRTDIGKKGLVHLKKVRN
ncbi:MAG: phosphoribosylamine--glycine ligase [Candidatus Kapaibacteriales bacterium]